MNHPIVREEAREELQIAEVISEKERALKSGERKADKCKDFFLFLPLFTICERRGISEKLFS